MTYMIWSNARKFEFIVYENGEILKRSGLIYSSRAAAKRAMMITDCDCVATFTNGTLAVYHPSLMRPAEYLANDNDTIDNQLRDAIVYTLERIINDQNTNPPFRTKRQRANVDRL